METGTNGIHEVADLFPLMREDEYQALLADIKVNGQLEPIWIYQSKIIDGRHRHRACQELGIEPSFREWPGKGSLVAFVASLNLQRRHLTSGQRAMIGVDIEQFLAKEAEERRLANLKRGNTYPDVQISGHREIGRASDNAACIVRTNGQYILDAKTILKQAPELKTSVTCGALTLPEAKTLAKLPAEQRTEALQMITRGVVKTAKGAVLELKKAEAEAQVQAVPSKPSITQASWEEWLSQQPSCDLLLTDPPYSTDVEDIRAFAAAWLPLALAKVQESGRAYVFIGAYPQELEAYLTLPVPSHLRRLNVLVWAYKNTLGPQPSHAYKQNWQAILYFAGVNAPPLDSPVLTEQFTVQDINAPDGRLGNHYHAWQKTDELAERLIRHSTASGDTVLDCFAGTGTFLLAAHRLGRVASGCEISEKMLKLAEKRGCNIVLSPTSVGGEEQEEGER